MAGVYYIPSGPKNLAVLFPSIDWTLVKDYTVSALSGGTTLATTPLMTMGCCCDTEDVTLHFLNYLGGYDSISFQKPLVTHEATDSVYQKSLNYPLVKTDFGIGRYNVKANDTYEARNTCLDESDLFWVQELYDSPSVFLQWAGTEGQSDSYLPIVVVEAKFTKESNDFNTITSVVTIKFKFANEYTSIRG